MIFGVFTLIILIEHIIAFGVKNRMRDNKRSSRKWNLSVRRVLTICNESMIQGVIKFGHAWAIPKEAEKSVEKN